MSKNKLIRIGQPDQLIPVKSFISVFLVIFPSLIDFVLHLNYEINLHDGQDDMWRNISLIYCYSGHIFLTGGGG